MGEACSTDRAMRNTYKISAGKPEGKRALGRHRHRWENSVRIDLTGTRWEGLNPSGSG
jgi:hypothetical protein